MIEKDGLSGEGQFHSALNQIIPINLDTAVMNFLREYGPLSPSKRKDTPTGKILAASAAQVLEQIGRKRKLTMVLNHLISDFIIEKDFHSEN